MNRASLYGAKALAVLCKSTGAAAVALPVGVRSVTIIPHASTKVYLRAGKSDVTVDNSGFPIPAAAQPMRLSLSGATHIIGYAESDTTIEVVPGG